MFFPCCLVFLLTAGAVLMDLATGRIPNFWLCSGWLCGLLYQCLTAGKQGAGRFAAGSLLPLVLLWGLFYFRMLGAGDVKLLSVLGGIMGVPAVLSCIIWSMIFGAVLSAGVLIICGNFLQRLKYFTTYFKIYRRTGQRTPYRRAGERPENIHFSVAVLMGALLWIGGFY